MANNQSRRAGGKRKIGRDRSPRWSPSRANYHSSMKWIKNKKKKLMKHTRKFPGDNQAANALKVLIRKLT